MSPFTKATPRKTNQRGKKRSRSMILTDTPVHNDLDAEAAEVKRTTGRKVTRTLVPKKELKSAKRQNDTEEETCQCSVSDEPFCNSRPVSEFCLQRVPTRSLSSLVGYG